LIELSKYAGHVLTSSLLLANLLRRSDVSETDLEGRVDVASVIDEFFEAIGACSFPASEELHDSFLRLFDLFYEDRQSMDRSITKGKMPSYREVEMAYWRDRILKREFRGVGMFDQDGPET
jgi:hypothetical protein